MNRFRKLGPAVSRWLIPIAAFVLGAVIFSWGSSETEPHAGHPAEATGAASQPATDEGAVWTCSMHPQIRRSEPGQCPICGMDLIIASSSDDDSADPTEVVLSVRAKKLAQLRTAPVRRRSDASAQLELLGRVEIDETKRKTVTAWTGGRIDRLHVNVTGEKVRAGQVIATLYSPEVFAAHQDLLVAKSQVERMRSSPQSAQAAAGSALQAARQRLRILGVPDNELARMETQSNPTQAVKIRTPFGGTVIERLASEGAYVSTGSALYKVASLQNVWIQLDAYESDLSRLSVGQQVQVTVRALPGEVFEGKITFIDPTVDQRRRTARVRVSVSNKDGQLRPGMFAEARVTAGSQEASSPLVVPRTAPLFTGRRSIVYVETPGSHQSRYQARTVRLGPRLGDYYPVVAGLSEGERVVVRGAFVLDADLQIRGGRSMMTSSDDNEPGAWDTVVQIGAADRKQLAPVVAAYLEVQKALAEDDLVSSQTSAQTLDLATRRVRLKKPVKADAAWQSISKQLQLHSKHLSGAKDLEGARSGFEGLSHAMETLLRVFGNPLDQPLSLAFCPMALGSQGATWIQTGSKIDNAYFGASMRSCGEVRQEVGSGAFLPPAASAASQPASDPHAGHKH